MRVDFRMELRSVGTALRLAESVLLAGGQRQARRNAWAAVCENRRYAAAREFGGGPTDVPAGAPGGVSAGGPAKAAHR
ncbi:hypothetical protein ACIQ9P_02485 [Kitasatospora sp. NPDC094019]|uniref:hypothetical protein n=1 Tax=Kitasatospora sp. NPDC094019 TaxID=3364091 RepID=UPI0037FC91BE